MGERGAFVCAHDLCVSARCPKGVSLCRGVSPGFHSFGMERSALSPPPPTPPWQPPSEPPGRGTFGIDLRTRHVDLCLRTVTLSFVYAV